MSVICVFIKLVNINKHRIHSLVTKHSLTKTRKNLMQSINLPKNINICDFCEKNKITIKKIFKDFCHGGHFKLIK